MELIMTTDLERELPAVINFNFEALKANLIERLDHYNGLVVTEDTIKECKEDKAKLNALRTALENERKRVKKMCLKPYEGFETKEKELVALIDKPIAAIDDQLKVFEEKRKQEKYQAIEGIYEMFVPDHLKTIIPLDRIGDPKWLNSTFKIKQVNEALEEIVKRTEADLLALGAVEPEHTAAVRAKYIETLDIAAALQHRSALIKAAEAFRQHEAEKVEEQPAAPVKAAQKPENKETETLYSLRLEFQLTMNQANALKSFLAQQGINYRKI